MEAKPYRFTIELTLNPPFLSHKSGAQRLGYDMSMLRDSDDKPVFLGSLIRGNLLHTLTYFNEKLGKENDDLKTVIGYFGTASWKSNDAPERAVLNFSYYWTLNEDAPREDPTTPRYRIGIDNTTGTIEKGNVQVIEAPFKSGANDILFTGDIHAHLTENQAEKLDYWLNKALGMIAAIGALKGTGFGRISKADCKCQKLDIAKKQRIDINNNRIDCCLTLDRPFCIAEPHTRDNRFISAEFIPGNAIIGAIAQHYQSYTKQTWFNKIHIRHAFAAHNTQPQRNTVLPLSLAFFEDKFIDLALLPNPEQIFLLKKDGHYHAPEF